MSTSNLTYVDNAQVRVGKFKVPFGLDQMTGVTRTISCIARSAPIYLASGRDIGVMVHGRFFNRGLNYWAGVFRHDGDNSRSKQD